MYKTFKKLTLGNSLIDFVLLADPYFKRVKFYQLAADLLNHLQHDNPSIDIEVIQRIIQKTMGDLGANPNFLPDLKTETEEIPGLDAFIENSLEMPLDIFFPSLLAYLEKNMPKYTENDSKIGISAAPKPRG